MTSSATLSFHPADRQAAPARPDAPVVVVGTGPVGVRFVQGLHERDPHCPIVVYGREPWAPYNRVQLSSFLQGLTDWSSLTQGLALPETAQVDTRLHHEITHIDLDAREVHDQFGRVQPFSTLVLALGSRARVPDVPGVGQAHVFAFRDLSDAHALMARQVSSRHTVVLGGGLLGIEAARAMQRLNTQVTIIEQAPRLMARQLDASAAQALQTRLEQLGMRVITGVAVKRLRGQGQVTGVELRDGTVVEADTVLIAAGIVPNTALALDAGLSVGRGIRVDDRMRTSHPDVLAIGECAEHRGEVHGLVAPGLEQAGVAVHTALGGEAHYEGTVTATRLKVAGVPVCSVGVLDADLFGKPLQLIRRADPLADTHLTVALHEHKMVGLAAVGEVPHLGRLQEAVLAQRWLWPWQVRRLRRQGRFWADDTEDSVLAWTADTIVCQCNQVSRGQLGEAMAQGCDSVESLSACTRAGTVCGSCKPLMTELVAGSTGRPVQLPALPAWRSLATGTVLAGLLALLLLLVPGIVYWDTVQDAPRWHRLWTDGSLKQWTGYSVLALTAVGLVMSLRKRADLARRWGSFDGWRLMHTLLGAAALAGLMVHTGARLGARADAALMLCFLGLALLGVTAAAVTAWQHRLSPALVGRWRRVSTWGHILLSWPVPLLLALHILKSYWY